MAPTRAKAATTPRASKSVTGGGAGRRRLDREHTAPSLPTLRSLSPALVLALPALAALVARVAALPPPPPTTTTMLRSLYARNEPFRVAAKTRETFEAESAQPGVEVGVEVEAAAEEEDGRGPAGSVASDSGDPAPTAAPTTTPSSPPPPPDGRGDEKRRSKKRASRIAIAALLSLVTASLAGWASYAYRFAIATCCRNCCASLRRYGLRGWALYLLGRRPDAHGHGAGGGDGSASLNEIIFDPDEALGGNDLGRGLLS